MMARGCFVCQRGAMPALELNCLMSRQQTGVADKRRSKLCGEVYAALATAHVEFSHALKVLVTGHSM